MCVVLPLPVSVFGMLLYAWFVVLHLHVLGSFVVTLSVVCVVPAGNCWLFVGAVMVAVGGVVSEGGGVVGGAVAPQFLVSIVISNRFTFPS